MERIGWGWVGSYREYLTGCSEVFKKKKRKEEENLQTGNKGKQILHQSSPFHVYSAFGKAMKRYDDNDPVYFTVMLQQSRETMLSKVHQWREHCVTGGPQGKIFGAMKGSL